MIQVLTLRNRQRVRRVNTPLLRRITLRLLGEFLRVPQFELAIHLVATREMTRVNEQFLHHHGSTDVITFDYANDGFEAPVSGLRLNQIDGQLETRISKPGTGIHGELFVCVSDAVTQAKQFRARWQSELVRYVIHGLLHLCGHEDLAPAALRRMKREENRLMRRISHLFNLAELEARNSKPES